MTTEKKDVFQKVTEMIVAAIEEGAGTYKMPWRTSGGFPSSPINAVSKRPYRGINVLVLWATAQEKGYRSGTWATYKQWQELGAQVRKGEKSANVVFWKFFDREQEQQESAEGSETHLRKIPMARDYWVFNAEQVEGYTVPDQPQTTREERIGFAEQFFQNLSLDLRPGENRAFYSPDTDSVHMPAFEAFREPLFYYSVLSHETTHWTGSKPRLNRDLTGRFGTESYAVEELIAELGAAFLCAELGLPTDPRQDHAPYIASWLKVLKNDKRAIFTAAAKAQEAVDWMIKQQPNQVQEAA
ncbi:MAG: ssDNA-binding domain-containing protein [Cyanobacteria bacterium]|nr:ssDNA-binding domain-containing protein [Cyanobacteriota bacterium]